VSGNFGLPQFGQNRNWVRCWWSLSSRACESYVAEAILTPTSDERCGVAWICGDTAHCESTNAAGWWVRV
jgi:hypothetical protein